MSQLAIQSSGVTPPTIPAIKIPSASLTPTELVTVLLGWLIWGAGIIAFGFLIYGGILFVLSGGDADKTTKARNTILYAVVGIIVVAASLAIYTWANSVVGK